MSYRAAHSLCRLIRAAGIPATVLDSGTDDGYIVRTMTARGRTDRIPRVVDFRSRREWIASDAEWTLDERRDDQRKWEALRSRDQLFRARTDNLLDLET